MEEDNNTWTTWDELLLTCAVKRHGLNSWDSIATELKNRTSKSLNPEICKNKFTDLKKRFNKDFEFDDSKSKNNIPWLEELRKLRVEELKQEVHRHDLSIQCLQLKVKRLEEEREKPDLEKENGNGKSDSGSNSSKKEKNNPIEPVKIESVKIETDEKPESCNGSSETVGRKLNQVKKVESEVRNSDESTSLTKDRRRNENSPTTGGGSPARGGELKGELLDVLKGVKGGGVFEKRLDSQKTDKYKNIVRQHMDLEIVRSRIDDGSYSSSILKFYLDLLLMSTNAIVFFPKQSSESLAGYSLRDIILKKIKEHRNLSQVPKLKPETKLVLEPKRPDPFLTKHKHPSLPLIVSRKRSSISTKPLPEKEKLSIKPLTKPPSNEEDSLVEIKVAKEKPVTGVRSMRRSSSNKQPTVKNTNQVAVVPKEELAKKKSGAADFLKRIKKNSPVKEKEKAEEGKKNDDSRKRVVDDPKKKHSSGGGGGGGKRKAKEDSPSKKMGRPPKGGKDVVVPGKREKEGGEEVGNERPKKKTKR